MKLKDKVELYMIENMGLINGFSQIALGLTTGQIYDGIGTAFLSSCYKSLSPSSGQLKELPKQACKYPYFKF